MLPLQQRRPGAQSTDTPAGSVTPRAVSAGDGPSPQRPTPTGHRLPSGTSPGQLGGLKPFPCPTGQELGLQLWGSPPATQGLPQDVGPGRLTCHPADTRRGTNRSRGNRC